MLSFPQLTVKGNKHTLSVQIIGANPQAVRSFMFGLDYLRVKKADGRFVAGKTSVTKTTDSRAAAAPPNEGVLPTSSAGKPLNLDFETGTLDGWVSTGDAFEGQPIQGDTVAARRTEMQSRHAGEYWIGGFEKHGDSRTGTLTSNRFW